MPDGQKQFVWRCLNRIEHGKRICKHSATVDEPELQAAVTAALNEMFRQREARETLAQCVAAALAGTGGDNSLPAVEAKLRALQDEQMNLFRLAASAGLENTEYDDRMRQPLRATACFRSRGNLRINFEQSCTKKCTWWKSAHISITGVYIY